jgi:hypothetical protein
MLIMPLETVDKLNDLKYADWCIKMEALLDEKELWDLVSGDETIPLSSPNSKAVKTFKQKQQLAHTKIILHVENWAVSVPVNTVIQVFSDSFFVCSYSLVFFNDFFCGW